MGKDILHRVGNGGHCGCETVSRESTPMIREKGNEPQSGHGMRARGTDGRPDGLEYMWHVAQNGKIISKWRHELV